jgi:hypothetical protein
MSRPDKDTQPEPGTDDARSGDSEESRRDREQARKNAEHMIEQRLPRQPPAARMRSDANSYLKHCARLRFSNRRRRNPH